MQLATSSSRYLKKLAATGLGEQVGSLTKRRKDGSSMVYSNAAVELRAIYETARDHGSLLGCSCPINLASILYISVHFIKIRARKSDYLWKAF